MFDKVLIANRGEIALRIIRACREMGLKTVAVYSEADRDALHVRFADEDICIGKPQVNESYLDPKRIIAAAEITNAGAIHPGYGFLAENADFAEICESCGMVFIGPTPDQIRMLGNKVKAKELMRKSGVPTIPGSEGIVPSFHDALELAKEITYPVIVKAVSGGGGKGMRVCHNDAELERGFHIASTEAGNAFGDPDLYLEKFIVGPHHVEIQLMGDTHGNFFHFGERDCSIQRRHQKLIEETPSPLLTPELRKEMGDAAVRGAKMVNYRGAGTMEFLVDEDLKYFFMEMNTRIQVEHPVTEEAYEVDLVKDQLKVAMGQELKYNQDEIIPKWAVIECRINAEDIEKDFRPTPGKLTALNIPGGLGVRIETATYTDYVIPPYYDSMIAKLIVKGRTREEALVRLSRALDEYIVEGVPTTIPFHKEIIRNPDFIKGNYDINFLENYLKKKTDPESSEKVSLTLKGSTEKVVDKKTESESAVLETNQKES